CQEDVVSERSGAHGVECGLQLFVRRGAELARSLVQHRLLARLEDEQEQQRHHRDADCQQKQDAQKFAQQIFPARHRLRQNRVNSAVLDVLRNQTRRYDNREERSKDRHRAERNVFQDLEFLLETEPREKNRAPYQRDRENEQDVENSFARHLGQRMPRDRKNSCAHFSDRSDVSSRNKRSSVVVDLRRSISFAFELAASFSISFSSDSEAFSKTSSFRFSIAISSSSRPSRTRAPFERIPTRSQIS